LFTVHLNYFINIRQILYQCQLSISVKHQTTRLLHDRIIFPVTAMDVNKIISLALVESRA